MRSIVYVRVASLQENVVFSAMEQWARTMYFANGQKPFPNECLTNYTFWLGADAPGMEE